MFMTAAILARTGSMPDRARDLDRAAQLLIAYAGRLQQPDGIFNHATDGPAAWGRGNGFAAFGLMETLTAMPAGSPVARGAAGDLHQKQMKGLAAWQAPDGMWREIIDRPGAYREETATAMILTAMARGVRLGWLDRSYAPGCRSRLARARRAHHRGRRRWSTSAAEPAPARPRATTSIGRRSKAPTTAAARWRWSPLWSDVTIRRNRRDRKDRREIFSLRSLRSPRFLRRVYAMMSWITLPDTSVRRKSRPL